MRTISMAVAIGLLGGGLCAQTAAPAGEPPRINGPSVFGVRPGHPLLYAIPATGERPVAFAAEGLPAGLHIDAASGQITGRLAEVGEHSVTLRVRNRQGQAVKKLTIKCGERICLTPPMGWNSWNCWGATVDREKVLRAARAMASSGLAEHGWTYINIDDGWQGRRSGPGGAIQGNERFLDLAGLGAAVHALGLKLGLYSTPWITSYAGYGGGSADNAVGAWQPDPTPESGRRFGQYTFIGADVRQWAEWGVDYLKYDWDPLDVEHARAVFQALRGSGRDIVLSLSNAADIALAGQWPAVANSWRTTGDIGDRWQYRPGDKEAWRYGVAEIGFAQDRWAPAAGPGHWNDADMLVVGQVGWGGGLRPTALTADEQYSHFTLWCMLSSPLLLGCDLERLDVFTLALLTNDEVIAIDQDALGQPARHVAAVGAIDVYLKSLEDGGHALAFFNRAATAEKFTFNKLKALGLGGRRQLRDLWRRRDLPESEGTIEGVVPGHGVWLLRVAP